METIKVKINKISNAADTAMIGKTLQIDNGCSGDNHFRIPYEGHDWYVLKSDCEIITDTITVTADKIRAMAAKSPQVKEVLKEGFPECFEEDKSVNVLESDFHFNGKLCVRLGGEYANKGFWLEKDYDWEIKTDAFGCLVLIPTKK